MLVLPHVDAFVDEPRGFTRSAVILHVDRVTEDKWPVICAEQTRVAVDNADVVRRYRLLEYERHEPALEIAQRPGSPDGEDDLKEGHRGSTYCDNASSDA
jgi:hypothetical protein